VEDAMSFVYTALPDTVRYWAVYRPDHVAVVDRDRAWTYGQLDEVSNRIARAVVEYEVVPSPHIGYLGKNSTAFWAIWLGVTKAGRGIAPLNWRCTVPELVELVRDARITMLFATDDQLDTAFKIRAESGGLIEVVACGSGFESWLSGRDASDPHVAMTGDETALLAYTSGTTGIPKGVQITHRAIGAWFEMSRLEPAERWVLDDVMLHVMPNFHLAGSFVPLPALRHGATIAVLPAFEPSALIDAITAYRPTVTCLVPTAIQMLVSNDSADRTVFASLRRLLYAGSPIAPDTLQRAIEILGCDFVQFYGTTEAGLITMLRPDDHDTSRPEILTSCGRPLPLVEIRVVDGEGADVAVGEVGELWVRSPMAFTSYWERPDETGASLVDGWYHTGDLGRCDDIGYYYLVDRLKDLIVTGGENVYSIEVERALYRHEAVVAAAVVGEPDEKWGERIVAHVALAQEGTVGPDELIAHCRHLIAGYKVPKEVFIHSSLPTTASGKIQKALLRKARP
jgi:acyl-CoA synthetase (AMP-forming)/AMP-acid ligase II